MAQPSYIPLREAFDLIGKRIFPDQWNEQISHSENSHQHGEVKGILVDAMGSGEVEMNFSDFDHRGNPHTCPLKSSCVSDEYFLLDIVKGQVRVNQPSEPIDLRLHKRGLENFIREGLTRHRKSISADEKRCEKVLIEIFNESDEKYSRAEIVSMMRDQFLGLSNAAIERARKKAIEATGREDLKKPGRPRIK